MGEGKGGERFKGLGFGEAVGLKEDATGLKDEGTGLALGRALGIEKNGEEEEEEAKFGGGGDGRSSTSRSIGCCS